MDLNDKKAHEIDKQRKWYVYILECADQTFYTGVTPRLYQRLAAHNAGRGAKYTKCRIPVKLLYWEICQDRSEALKREAVIKKMKRNEKIKLCKTFDQ